MWNDHPEALRTITLSLDDLPKTLGLSSFIEKTGDAKRDILRAYVKGNTVGIQIPDSSEYQFSVSDLNSWALLNSDTFCLKTVLYVAVS